MNTMSALLQIIDLSFSRGHHPLFEQLSLTINAGERVGLVGHNGCGKSSLLSLISGNEDPDSGEIRTPRGLKIAFVEQFVPQSLMQQSLLQGALDVFSHEDIPSMGWMAESQLLGLGFTEAQFSIPVRGLSGGQQNLLLIARALLQEPELLLMDEPGNHMDILAMSQLERFLGEQCQCPFLIISHDRHLLNKVCTKTVFIRDKRSYAFELPYDAAAERLEEHDQQASKHRELEEKEIKRLKATAKRLAIWGREHDNESLSKKAKSIEKRAAKLDEEKTEVSAGSTLNLQLDNLNLSARQILTLEEAVIYTPDQSRQLLSIDHIVIRPGDRVAILGANGVGKSSLLETIRKQFSETEKSSGSIRFNPRTTLGYFDQGLESVDVPQSRSTWLSQQTESNNDEIKKTLINSGVSYQDFSRKVDSLSGGEKARMVFMALQLNRPTLMILDEPTNHIDLFGKQQLCDQLEASGATLLITSHDRYFLDQIATRWLWINEGVLQEIHDSDTFYTSLKRAILPPGVDKNELVKPLDSDAGSTTLSEDTILQRIDMLENKLLADQKRKIKNQKPILQQEWQEELTSLWSQLDSAD